MYFDSGNFVFSSILQQVNFQLVFEFLLLQIFFELVVVEKQYFIEKLIAIIWKNFFNLEMIFGFDKINYIYMLIRCIQVCKINFEYIYVFLKEIFFVDIFKNKKFLIDGYVCEVRC